MLVYIANFAGAIGTALLVGWSGTLDLGGGAPRETVLIIARAKTALSFDQALVSGILCNVLVCLAVWISAAARRVSGKILAIVFPISAFVALGFEHSVANMYFIALAMLQAWGDPALTVPASSAIWFRSRSAISLAAAGSWRWSTGSSIFGNRVASCQRPDVSCLPQPMTAVNWPHAWVIYAIRTCDRKYQK